jgi:hypothetical protein
MGTRYDPFQRLWGKHNNHNNKESSPSNNNNNCNNYHKPPPQDECTLPKADNVLLPQAKRSAILSKANELTAKFLKTTGATATESTKTKAPGDLPQQQRLRPSPKKKSRRTLPRTTSNKKFAAPGTSNTIYSALAPFPSVTPTPGPTTTTTTTKPLPHHMEPTNFLERFDKAQNTAPKKDELLSSILTDPPEVQRMGSPFQNQPPRVVDDGNDIPFDDDNDMEYADLLPNSTTAEEQQTVVKPRRPLTKVSKCEMILRESLDTSDTWQSGALHARLELEFPPLQPHDVVVSLVEKENKTLSRNASTRPHSVTKPNWRSVPFLLASLIPMDGQGPPPSVVPTRTVSGIGASKFHQRHYYLDLPIVVEDEWNASFISHLLQPQPIMETVETSIDRDASWKPLGWLGGSWF